jgi:hypothetical protein
MESLPSGQEISGRNTKRPTLPSKAVSSTGIASVAYSESVTLAGTKNLDENIVVLRCYLASMRGTNTGKDTQRKGLYDEYVDNVSL